MWTVPWPFLTALLLPSPPEPIPCGREVVGHLSKRPWGMTHISRQAQGDHGSPVTRATARPVQIDTSPPKGLSQTPPEARRATWRAALSRRARTPAWCPCPGQHSTSSGLVNRWGGRPRERPEPLGRAGHAPGPGGPAAPYHHPGSCVSTGVTLLIPADPVPQLLLGPVMGVGACVCEHTHMYTHAHTPRSYPATGHTPSRLHPVPGPTDTPIQKTRTCQTALQRPHGCWAPSQFTGLTWQQSSGLMQPTLPFTGAQVGRRRTRDSLAPAQHSWKLHSLESPEAPSAQTQRFLLSWASCSPSGTSHCRFLLLLLFFLERESFFKLFFFF